MPIHRRTFIATLAAAAIAAISLPALAQSGDPVVFAAASLKNALDEATAQWSKQSGKKVSISYGASSALAKQIEAGAPAQMFISADLDWMNHVAEKKLIKPETRSNLLANRIVLVAPKDSNVTLTVGPNFALAKALNGGKLAMANTDSVPAGKYGKAALEKLGVWSSVQSSIAQAQDVRAALALVARKEAPLGIVYQTDAAAEPNVKIVGAFPENSHPPIIYPIALTSNATSPDITSLLTYLRSPAARPAFEKQGFTVLRNGGQS
jgi:molybdate transport system substrate-binding protein